MDTPQITLNTGEKIPQVGLGLWKIKDEQECKSAVKDALEAGYRLFDTAQVYQNEEFVGAALQEAGIDRGEIFITTKIWNDNMWPNDLEASFEESLEKLQTDYVDLLLLHFPVTELRRPAWYVMQEVYESRQAKAIGVSNYTVRHLEELLKECRIKPAVNQIELQVYLQQPDLIAYCQANGIVVEAYSPLAHGRGIDNTVLQKIADKYGKSIAQIMIRWCIERGSVPLPKSINKKRIAENIDVFDFSLDDQDMQEIARLDKDMHTSWDPTNTP